MVVSQACLGYMIAFVAKLCCNKRYVGVVWCGVMRCGVVWCVYLLRTAAAAICE